MAVEGQVNRAVFRLPSLGEDVEGAVAEALASSREPKLGRIELQVREMDDAVRPAFEVRRQPWQPAGQALEEAVVEPPDPRLAGADDMTAVTIRAGDDLQVGDDVDDAEARDKVALHRARQQDFEPARHE